jgi:uncharacterized membrane protein
MRPRKNASILTSGIYAALVTMFGGSWYFLISLALALGGGGDLGQVVVDTILGCIVCWVFFTFIFFEIGKMFDEFNNSGRRPDDDGRNGDGTGGGPGGDRNDNHNDPKSGC